MNPTLAGLSSDQLVAIMKYRSALSWIQGLAESSARDADVFDHGELKRHLEIIAEKAADVLGTRKAT